MIQIKRAYDASRSSPEDGYRILIDRLWPRGIKKAELHLDEWAKDLAPSTELRKVFGHDPARWQSFRTAYRRELRSPWAWEKIRSLAKLAHRGTVTLLYSAKDEIHNDAVVLKEAIEKELATGVRGNTHSPSAKEHRSQVYRKVRHARLPPR